MTLVPELFVRRLNKPKGLPINVRDVSVTGDGQTDDYAALNEAVRSAGATGTLYFPAGTYVVGTNLTIPACCIFAFGAKLKPSSGVTVTLSGPVETAPGESIIAAGTAGTVSITGSLESSGGVLDVRAFGAKGDGVTDDTAAIQAAIDAAYATNATLDTPWGRGARVLLPPGIYGVSGDLDIPPQVRVIGSGTRTTVVRWIGDDAPTDAVFTSNLDGRWTFVHGSSLEDMTVDANGEANGVKLFGWNEGAFIRDLHIREYTGVGAWLGPGIQPQTYSFQNTFVEGLWLLGLAGSTGVYADGLKRVHFHMFTHDVTGATTEPADIGIHFVKNTMQVRMTAPNLEDCSIGAVVEGGANNLLFEQVNFDAPNTAPRHDANTIISGAPAATVGIYVKSDAGNQWGNVSFIRATLGLDYLLYDDALSFNVPGIGEGGAPRNYAVTYGVASQTASAPGVRNISTTAAALNVSVANHGTLAVFTTDGNVEFVGLTGGSIGQSVRIIKATQTNSVIIRHNSGSGTQKFICPAGTDLTLNDYEGATFVWNGSFWFPA